jgi:competence transcription factor ComK
MKSSKTGQHWASSSQFQHFQCPVYLEFIYVQSCQFYGVTLVFRYEKHVKLEEFCLKSSTPEISLSKTKQNYSYKDSF